MSAIIADRAPSKRLMASLAAAERNNYTHTDAHAHDGVGIGTIPAGPAGGAVRGGGRAWHIMRSMSSNVFRTLVFLSLLASYDVASKFCPAPG
jgi:hypothetical protein